MRILAGVTERGAGLIALALAAFSVAAGLYTQWQISEKSSCQYNINQQFLATIKQRAEIGNESTANINNLIKGVFSTKDPKVALQDYQTYLTRLDTINGELGKATFPDLGAC